MGQGEGLAPFEQLAPMLWEAQVQKTSGFRHERMKTLPVIMHRPQHLRIDESPGNEIHGGDQFYR